MSIAVRHWVFAGLICSLVATAQADVVLSNLPGTGSGTGSNLGLGTDLVDRTKAVGLTMGASGMNFLSLDALISNPSPASQLSGGIYSNVGGNPGALLSGFTPVDIADGFGPAEVTLVSASAFELAANTSYWFVLDGPDTANSLLWQTLAPNTAPTATGVTYDGYRFSSNGGTSWTASGLLNGVRINAAPLAHVPEPGSLALLVGSLGLMFLTRRRS